MYLRQPYSFFFQTVSDLFARFVAEIAGKKMAYTTYLARILIIDNFLLVLAKHLYTTWSHEGTYTKPTQRQCISQVRRIVKKKTERRKKKSWNYLPKSGAALLMRNRVRRGFSFFDVPRWRKIRHHFDVLTAGLPIRVANLSVNCRLLRVICTEMKMSRRNSQRFFFILRQSERCFVLEEKEKNRLFFWN